MIRIQIVPPHQEGESGLTPERFLREIEEKEAAQPEDEKEEVEEAEEVEN